MEKPVTETRKPNYLHWLVEPLGRSGTAKKQGELMLSRRIIKTKNALAG